MGRESLGLEDAAARGAWSDFRRLLLFSTVPLLNEQTQIRP